VAPNDLEVYGSTRHPVGIQGAKGHPLEIGAVAPGSPEAAE
jgi:hypothetical protein